MTGASANPLSSVRSPTAALKEKRSRGESTMPEMRSAARRMLCARPKFSSLKYVVQEESSASFSKEDASPSARAKRGGAKKAKALQTRSAAAEHKNNNFRSPLKCPPRASARLSAAVRRARRRACPQRGRRPPCESPTRRLSSARAPRHRQNTPASPPQYASYRRTLSRPARGEQGGRGGRAFLAPPNGCGRMGEHGDAARGVDNFDRVFGRRAAERGIGGLAAVEELQIELSRHLTVRIPFRCSQCPSKGAHDMHGVKGRIGAGREAQARLQATH